MKKIVALILALSMLFALGGCGAKEPEPEPEPKARDLLNTEELALFTAITKISTATFYEPSKVRVLEIVDYDQRTTRDKDSIFYGPDTVIVRLQGENRVGGTLNHYYRIVIVGAENTSEEGQESIAVYERAYSLGVGFRDSLMDYKGEIGDFIEYDDEYVERYSQYWRMYGATFDIGNINRALAEYWEEMGF